MILNFDNCTSDTVADLVQRFFNSIDIDDKQNKEINLSWDEQKKFLDLTVLHPLLKDYPMKRDYCKTFLKKMINILEKYNEHVHDELYESYCTFMQCNQSPNDFCYKHYLIRGENYRFVTIKESSNLIIDGTTGLRTWEAATVLADWALSNKNEFRGKHILELGSGLGMTGIVIAKFCDPAQFCFSDCHSQVLSVLEENIQTNFSGLVKTIHNEKMVLYHCQRNENSPISVLKLDWNCAAHVFNEIVPDVVIGADIVYDPSTFQDLCDMFTTFFSLNHCLKIFLVCTVRNEETTQEFIEKLCQNNYKIDMLHYNHSSYIHWNGSKKYYVMRVHK